MKLILRGRTAIAAWARVLSAGGLTALETTLTPSGRRSGPVLALALILFSAACNADPVVPETQAGPSQAPSEGLSIDALAQTFAVAVADHELRLRLLEDLRDSPFPNHAIHLASYLAGDRGRPIMQAMAAGSGMQPTAFLSGLSASGNIGLFVNPLESRETWRGDGNLVVWPIDPGVSVADAATGYGPGGDPVTFSPFARATSPYFIVHVSPVDFGPDPESTRSAAPTQSRSTVSSPASERHGVPRVLMQESVAAACEDTGEDCVPPCLFYPWLPECQEPPPPPPGPPPGSFYVAGTEDCVNYAVAGGDFDGIFDSCEELLADALGPRLILDVDDPLPTLEPYYAVQMDGTLNGKTLFKVFFALAYNTDSGHIGDSEYVVVWAVQEGGGYWSRDWMYTAAHEGTPAESNQLWVSKLSDEYGWMRRCCIQYVSETLRPVVWVARGKHASYGSQAACNLGGSFLTIGGDVCSSSFYWTDVVGLTSANLGRQGYHAYPMRDCTSSRVPHLYPGQECFWSGVNFRGWWGSSSGGASPYSGKLVSWEFY